MDLLFFLEQNKAPPQILTQTAKRSLYLQSEACAYVQEVPPQHLCVRPLLQNPKALHRYEKEENKKVPSFSNFDSFYFKQ